MEQVIDPRRIRSLEGARGWRVGSRIYSVRELNFGKIDRDYVFILTHAHDYRRLTARQSGTLGGEYEAIENCE